jgi:hypothetical protein
MPSIKTFVVLAVMVLATVWLYNRFTKSGGIATLGVPKA